MNKAVFILAVTILLLFQDPTQKPVFAVSPDISSSYYCLMDAGSGQVLLMKNADSPRPVASTTKIMTAILALEYCQSGEIARVSQHADQTAEYTIGLKAGQKLSVDELLKAALIKSSNDAAVVLAEHVAGDEQLFGHLMTMKAFCLGAFHTRFENASGLPAHEAYSTAYDLAVISCYAMGQSTFRDMVGTNRADFKHPGYSQPYTIYNTNSLLDTYPGANGVKTGTTDAAGKCLVGSARRQGRELIAVVLRSGDRAKDCTRLLDYGFKSMQNVKIVDDSVAWGDLVTTENEPAILSVYPAEALQVWQGTRAAVIEKKARLHFTGLSRVNKGDKVGYLEVYSGGKLLKRVNLIAGNDIRKPPSLYEQLWQEFINWKRIIRAGKE
ncbi:MAG: D-alanyl-D-alanine carboxypeptidase family protein [Syntrophomonadaceae bacterium]